jgi:hypothetical protein
MAFSSIGQLAKKPLLDLVFDVLKRGICNYKTKRQPQQTNRQPRLSRSKP